MRRTGRAPSATSRELLTGPPRVSPFFSDLDPTTGNGRVFLNAASDQYTVTWCNVRGFDSTRTTTVQATLLPNGSVEMKFGPTVTVTDAIVALSPGRTGIFAPVNLSEPGPTAGGAAAVGERFAADAQLDLVELSRKFYRTHADLYDQLVIWTDAPLISDAFAYETTIANEVRGIGLDIFNLASDFGSGGRLRSLVVMDWLGKYPDSPTQKFLGENNTLSVLGQEIRPSMAGVPGDLRPQPPAVGHPARPGRRALELLLRLRRVRHGRQRHRRPRRRVVPDRRRRAALQPPRSVRDGARAAERRAAVLLRREPDEHVEPTRTRESAPQVGVTFNGTRREVRIQDVVDIHGPRAPTADESSRVHRQAFIYLVSAGRTADSGQVAKLDRIRRAWEGFFLQATDRRMQAVTVLR